MPDNKFSIFDKMEFKLSKIIKKYPRLISLIVSSFIILGWVVDHSRLSKMKIPILLPLPTFSTYKKPADSLYKEIALPHVAQLKPAIAQEWHMGLGSVVNISPGNIPLYSIKITESYLIINVPEDHSARAFNLNELPMSVLITSKSGKHIVSVEEKIASGYKLKVYDLIL